MTARARRVLSFLAAAAVTAAAGACRRAPEEVLRVADAGADAGAGAGARDGAGASPDAGSASSEGGAGDGADGAAAEDGGAPSPLRDFCNGAYTADADRMRATCAPEDARITQSMERAAANLCFADLSAALARDRATFDGRAADRCVEMLRRKPIAQTSETDTLFAHDPCDK